MKQLRIIGLLIASLTLAFSVYGQVSDAALTTQSNVIRNETTPGGNTRTRIADMYQAIIDSKVSLLGSYSNPSWITGLAWSKITSAPPFISTYPGAGIAVSTGSAWGTSITDNSANWNTAFGWGNHAGLYLLKDDITSLTSGVTTAVQNGNANLSWENDGGSNIMTRIGYSDQFTFRVGAQSSGSYGTGILLLDNTNLRHFYVGTSGLRINVGSDATGDFLQRNPSGYLSRLASVSAGSFLRSAGTSTESTWSTVKLPNTISANSIWVANSANTMTEVTPTGSQSIRRNSGNTAWEAYTPATGDMVLASTQTNSGAKTFLDNTLLMRNVANTFSSKFTNTNTAARTYTLPDVTGKIAIDPTTTDGDLIVHSGGELTSLATGLANESLIADGFGSYYWQAINGVTDGDKGDVTISGSGATYTVDADIYKTWTGNHTFRRSGTSSTVVIERTGSFTPNDEQGALIFNGVDSGLTTEEFGSIRVIAQDNTNGSEDSSMPFYIRSAGSPVNILSLSTSSGTPYIGLGGLLHMYPYTTAGLPSAATWSRGFAYDDTIDKFVLSNGTTWNNIVTETTSSTLTNKTFALGSNTLSGSLSEFNAALTGADFASLAGSETLTNKIIDPTANTIRYPVRTEAASGTYTLVAADENKTIEFTTASPITVTLPNGLSNSFGCTLVNSGGGTITLSATGTLESTATTIVSQYTGAYVQHKGSNVWTAQGALGTPVAAFTTEDAQDAVGAMVDASLTYVDGTPLLQRAALTGAVTATAGSNATSLGSFTVSQLSTAISDANISGTNTGDQTSIVGITGSLSEFNTALTGADFATGGGTATGTNTGDQSLANTSDATSHTVTLTGGTSVQLIEGSNITLTTGGTGSAATLTVASTGGGGITNGAAANELMKSDGTNAVASGLESTTAGNLTLGLSGTSGATRTVQAAGSASDVALTMLAKGASDATVGSVGTGRAILSAGGGWQLSAWNFSSGSVPANNIQGNSTSSTNANTAGSVVIAGGGTSSTVANTSGGVSISAGTGVGTNSSSGNVSLTTGAVTGSGTEGAVEIQTRSTGKLGFFAATPVVKQSAVTSAQEIADVLTAYGLIPSSTVSGGSGLTYAQSKALMFKMK